MGSSPSSNQKRSHVTISSSAGDVAPNNVRPSPHVRHSIAAFSYNPTRQGSQVNMDHESSLNVNRLTDSQQRMVRICLGQLETDLEITLDSRKLMDCVKVLITGSNLTCGITKVAV